MRYEREECLDLSSSLRRQWIETDGLGGYAASTILLCPTNRRHGLLVAPFQGNARRHSFLARFDEWVSSAGREFPLSVARYPGTLHPAGHQFLDRFEAFPWPTSTYRIGEVEVTREILAVRGAGVVLSRYRVSGREGGILLSLRPFVPFREADALTAENDGLDRSVERVPGGIRVRPYAALPALSLTVGPGESRFEEDAQWYRAVEYGEDLARGEAGREDLFSPGVFRIPLDGDGEAAVAATLGAPVEDPASLWRRESLRRAPPPRRARRTARPAPAPPPVAAALGRAAGHFLHRAPGGRPGVVAGFPSSGERGRDLFVALPGLLLARGRVEECGDALSGARTLLHGGRFEGLEDAAGDAALWFARAVLLYGEAGGSHARLRDELEPALLELAAACRDGADAGCLLPSAGGSVFSVEGNALWLLLLDAAARISSRAGRREQGRAWSALRRRAAGAFLERFWVEEAATLSDRGEDGVSDRRVRPAMVVAASLPWSPLSRPQRAALVAKARAELLTPRGLRSLSPADPAYRGDLGAEECGRCGAARPEFLGFYAEAVLRAVGRGRGPGAHLRGVLDGLEPALSERGLGHLSERYEGDPPHRPGGDFAHAAATGEVLRAFSLLGIRAG